jgi:carbamoyl-phosphate synthase large subunit
MNFKNKRIFISGGAGVIGREMVKILSQQNAIVMVGDMVEIPDDFPPNISYRLGDLNYITQQEIDCFAPEIFIHLAATFERSVETYEHWEENFAHNIRLSNYLMTLMRNTPSLKRVVYASSYLIYDKALYNFDLAKSTPIKLKESDPISPRNLTGLAKLAHEIELEFLAQFKSKQFTSICARIYRGYGKNSRDVISRWIRDLIDNKPITVYNPEGWFDYMFARDTAEGLLRLAEINGSGFVNLGTGKSRQVAEIVKILNDHFPNMKSIYKKSDIQYEASEADTTKLNELLSWVPHAKLESTIPEIIAYEKARVIKNNNLKNILVTSISAKVPLLNAVKQSIKKINADILLFGADINNACIGKYFVDHFWQMPKINELNINDFIQYCTQNNISLLIPTRDGELPYFSANKEILKKHKIHVLLADKPAIESCYDKLKFGQLKNINAIKTVENIHELGHTQFVVKERFGAGSLSIGINLSKEEALHHAKTLEKPIFQPFVKGKEISVDAYITRDGTIKGIIMRERSLVVNGESQITKTFENKTLSRDFERIIKTLNLYGHIVLQAIIDANNLIHVIECNPRFGGASTVALQAGLDSFYWAYLEAENIDLENYPFLRTKNEITQIRHAKDFYL